MKKIAIVLWIALVATLIVAPPAVAAKRVAVQVTSIAASMGARGAPPEGAPQVDPKLTGLAKKLRSLFAYRQYAFLGRAQSESEFGGSCAFQLPEHFTLEVEPERFETEGDGRIEMLVTLLRDVPARGRHPDSRGPQREIVLRTRIRLENGGTVLLGGPSISEGVLILALSARR